MAACLECHQHQVSREDRYCALCGAPLATLELMNGGQVTISPAEKGKVRRTMWLANMGQSDVHVSLVRPSPSYPLRLVNPQVALELRPFSSRQALEIEIDTDAWPRVGPSVLSIRYKTDASGQEGGEIRVTRGKTEPCSVKPSQINLGTITVSAARARCDFTIEVANPGATRQRCVVLEPPLGSKLVFSLAPDEDGGLPGLMSPRRLKLVAQVPSGILGDVTATCELAFYDESGEPFSTASVAIQARVAKAPQARCTKVQFGRVLPRQIVTAPLLIENTGSEPLTVTAITADTPMVRVIGQLPVTIAGGKTPQGATHSAQVRLVFSTHYDEELTPHDQQPLLGTLRLETNGEQRELHVQWSAVVYVPKDDPYGLLALDFGTTNSCVAYYDATLGLLQATAQPVAIGEGDTDYTIPSLITFLGSEQVYLIGKEAENIATGNPDGTVDSVKRMIAGGEREVAKGQWLTPVEMASCLIEQILLRACARLGKRPTRIAVTVPAAYWGPKRKLLHDACTRAWRQSSALGPSTTQDINVEVVDEPTAVAFYYINRHHDIYEQGPSKWLMVCDFGGGTFDISLIHVQIAPPDTDESPSPSPGVSGQGMTTIEARLARGDATLGGLDVDLGLLRGVCGEAQKKWNDFDPTPLTGLRDDFLELARRKRLDVPTYLSLRHTWLTEARKVKHTLSESDTAAFRAIVARGRGVETADFTLSKSDLHTYILDTFCQGVRRVVYSALAALDLEPDDMSVVMVSGQMSRVPAIRQLVSSIFPSKKVTVTTERDLPLKESVAVGAAELLARQTAQGPTSGYKVLPLKECSYRYGLVRPEGRGGHRFIELMALRHPMGEPTKPVLVSLTSSLGWGDLVLVQHAGRSTQIDQDDGDIRVMGRVRWQQNGQTDCAKVMMEFAEANGGNLIVTVDGVAHELTIPSDQEKSYV